MRRFLQARLKPLSNVQIALCMLAVAAIVLDAIDHRLFAIPNRPTQLAIAAASFYLILTALRAAESRFRLCGLMILQLCADVMARAVFDSVPDQTLEICVPALLIPALLAVPRRNWPAVLALCLVIAAGDFELFLSCGVFLGDPALTVGKMASAIAQTNVREAFDYALAHGVAVIGFALFMSGGMLYVKLRMRSRAALPDTTPGGTLAVAMILIWGILQLESVEPLRSVYEQVQRIHGQIRNWNTLRASRTAGAGAVSRAPRCCATHVVIIGESMNRNHMGVYGYPRPTTPRMSSYSGSPEFVLFSDAISPDVATMASLGKVLTDSTNERPIEFAKSVSIIEELKAAGFETTWLSNQLRVGPWDNEVGVMASGADHLVFLNGDIGSLLSQKHDQDLLPWFAKAIEAPATRNRVIFVHLIGCHAPYAERFDKAFNNAFSGPPPIAATDGSRVNLYDSAVLNDDFVVGSIVAAAMAHNASTVLYFSDHGEDVEFGGEHGATNFRKSMAEIPLMFWASPQYAAGHQSLMAAARANAHAPYATDGMFDTMLDLFDLDTPLYDATRSIVSQRFVVRRRWTVGGEVLYDDLQSDKERAPAGVRR